MHTEVRRTRKRRYAYESYRIAGHVATRYVGRIGDADVELAIDYNQTQDANHRRVKLPRNEERDSALTCEHSLAALDVMIDRWHVVQTLLDKCEKRTVMMPGKRRDSNDDSVDAVTEAAQSLPSSADFADLCKRVDSGDEAALSHFRRLVSNAPELFEDLVDLIDIAKEQTVAMIAGDSIAARHLVDLQLTREIDAILPVGELTVVKRMQAEVMLLQRLDFLRCHTALSRTPENQSDFRFWSGMTIRAKGRYQRALRDWSKTKS